MRSLIPLNPCPMCGNEETIYNNVIAKQSATVISSEDDFYYFCSECNNEVYKKDKYCHTCGRKLKWGKNNNELNIKLKSKFELYEEPQSSPIKDSGNRREFGTGAVRDMQDGKGRCDLLPAVAILRLARHFENGCKKYGDRNWEKGIPIHSFIDSAIRHLMKYLDGQVDEDHLCAAAWNCICAMWTEEKHPELQDIPSRVVTDIKTPDVPDKNVGEINKKCRNCHYCGLDASSVPCCECGKDFTRWKLKE